MRFEACGCAEWHHGRVGVVVRKGLLWADTVNTIFRQIDAHLFWRARAPTLHLPRPGGRSLTAKVVLCPNLD